MRYALIDRSFDLAECEVLRDFKTFDSDEWSIIKHPPKWKVTPTKIIGGAPDNPNHGQIFCNTPLKGDVILSFDARIVPPSYHDLVWFWNTRFDAEPWSAGYLGCLGGWWMNGAGIEKLPEYIPSAIAPSHDTKPGQTYHIVSGSTAGIHFIFVDGKLVTYFPDPAYPSANEAGYFGFGVYESMAEYSNLKVYRPKTTPRHPQYAPGR